jgi:hypothetical protein
LIRKQIGVAIGMAAAVAITVILFAASSSGGADVDRIRLWLACSSAAALWLMIAVARLARHRFFSAQDVDGAMSGTSSARARMLQAVIQNTLEQTVLAIAAYGAWLLLGPPSGARLVMSCAGAFSIGRLLFMIGYDRGAAARALGFALTFYPTVGLFLLALPSVISNLAAGLQGR